MQSRTLRKTIVASGIVALCGGAVVSGVVANASEGALPATQAVHGSAQQAEFGDLVRTGVQDADGELVFRAKKVDEADLPGIDFGVMAGHLRDSGKVSEDYMTNETEGSATSPGFHAVSGAATIDGTPYPAFGYYAGPAKKITATIDGAPKRAQLAPLPGVRGVVVFWFDQADGNPTEGLTAFDADGTKLPEGDTSVGVG